MAQNEEGVWDAAKKVAWGKWAITQGFTALETHMARSAGKYSVGDAVTMVDLVLVPQIYVSGVCVCVCVRVTDKRETCGHGGQGSAVSWFWNSVRVRAYV